MALAHPMLQHDARETIACDYYIDALNDAEFALKVRERVPTSLDEALRISLQLEAWIKDAKHTRHDVSAKPKVRGANTAESDHKQLDDHLSRLEDDMNRVLSELKEMNQMKQATSTGTVKAHPAVSEGKPNPGSPRLGTHQGFRHSKVVCWGYGQVGHVQRDCTHPKTHPENDTQ